MISDNQLKQIFTYSNQKNRLLFLPHINNYLIEYKLDNKYRLAAFLAQVGHESGQLRYVEEICSGKAYEGRRDLGNTQIGDGVKYKGRGLIQITGRYNYSIISKDLGIDFINNPNMLKEPIYATLSAFWFWRKQNLNIFCSDCEDDFKRITNIINGGYNGYSDRLKLWNIAKKVL